MTYCIRSSSFTCLYIKNQSPNSFTISTHLISSHLILLRSSRDIVIPKVRYLIHGYTWCSRAVGSSCTESLIICRRRSLLTDWLVHSWQVMGDWADEPHDKKSMTPFVWPLQNRRHIEIFETSGGFRSRVWRIHMDVMHWESVLWTGYYSSKLDSFHCMSSFIHSNYYVCPSAPKKRKRDKSPRPLPYTFLQATSRPQKDHL
jgi:hypothetical protein